MKKQVGIFILVAFILCILPVISACTDTTTHTHKIVRVERKDATCTTDGNIEYWRCTDCGKRFLDSGGAKEISNVIIRASHTGGTEIRDYKAPTEEEDGYSGDTYCLGCGEKTESGNVIDKLPHAHTTVKVDRAEATCTAAGNIEYWVCSGCSKKFSDESADTEIFDVVIPARHTGGTEIRDYKAPTEHEEGYSGDTYCLGCGGKISAGDVLPPLSDSPVIIAGDALVLKGEDTAEVIISVKNNPGISSLKFDVYYSDILSIKSVEFADEFGAYVTAPSPYINPQTFNWISVAGDESANGCFVKITFQISSDVTEDTVADIHIILDNTNIFDSEMNSVQFDTVDATVTIKR